MTLKAILLGLILMIGGSKVHAVRATVSHTVFYQKNKDKNNQFAANIILSWKAQSNTVHFLPDESGKFSADLTCVIRISKDSVLVKEEIFNIKTPARASKEIALQQVIVDQYDYSFPEGKYTIDLSLFEDNYKGEYYQFSDTFSVATVPDLAFLSGIQLLDTFYASTAPTIYTRNGQLDFPLASNYLNEKRSLVSCYYELYQANKIPKEQQPVKFRTYLSWKPFGNPVPKYDRTDSVWSGSDVQPMHTSFPIGSLASGNYYLNVVLTDRADLVIDRKCLFIQRYNPTPQKMEQVVAKDSALTAVEDTASAHVLDLSNTFVGKYNLTQVRAVLKMLLLISDASESISIQGFLKKPDEVYAKFFIYNFWEKRDKQNPDKAWKAYAETIKEVNRLFSENMPGYETDRGRIYIQYGKPNDRVIVSNETGAYPYEIWQYYNTEKQGREGVFLFYKPGRSLGSYDLLHSTLTGEKRNPNWRALLYNNTLTGAGNPSLDSRAEQYIGNK